MESHKAVLDELNCSDNCKRNIFNDHRELKREMFSEYGEMMKKAVDEDISPYAEHTSHGLNLRVVCYEDSSASFVEGADEDVVSSDEDTTQETVTQIKAMAHHWGLTCIEESQTNSTGPVWLRFRYVPAE